MKRPMTNAELIHNLMLFPRTGPMVQVVVLEGLRAYCAGVVKAEPGFLGDAGNMISEEAWKASAQEILDTLDNRDEFTVELDEED